MTTRPPDVDVPCNGCTACCRKQIVALFPEYGDDPAILSRHVERDGVLILDEAENGDCVYLQDGGCSVWEHRPVLCRTFDCRQHFRDYTRAQRRRMVKAGLVSKEIFDAGRARLHTLKDGA